MSSKVKLVYFIDGNEVRDLINMKFQIDPNDLAGS